MIIITGTGRSGTSLVSQLADRVGLDFGPRDRLIDSDDLNTEGYFESRQMVALNTRLIVGSSRAVELEIMPGRRPGPAQHLLRIPSMLNYLLRMYLLPMRPSALHRHEQRFARDIADAAEAHRNIAVKDPRFSATLGTWRNHVEIDRILYCFRHPRAAAESLKRARGFPIWLGNWILQNRIQSFLNHAQDIPCTVVEFERFFDPQTRLDEIRRLYDFADTVYDPRHATALLDEVVKPGMRHFQSSVMPTEGPARTLHELLQSLHAEHAEPRPFPAIDIPTALSQKPH